MPKEIETKDTPQSGTLIHGIAASEHLDSSGERINIKGLDISSLATSGVFNFEHKNENSSQIVGKVLYAKKIFDESDCSSEPEHKFWQKSKAPFVYVMGELFDAVGHQGAQEVAAMLRYDNQARSESRPGQNLINFSVEGAKLDKNGQEITRAIARKISITITPCNKMAVAEEFKPEEKKESILDGIFKSEGADTSVQLLEKADIIQFPKQGGKTSPSTPSVSAPAPAQAAQSPKTPAPVISIPKPTAAPALAQKPAAPAPAAAAPTSDRKKVASLPNWSGTHHKTPSGSAVSFNHSQFGTVTVHQNPSTKKYEVKHNGALAGFGGKKAIFDNPKDAVNHAHGYMGAIEQGTTTPKYLMNMPSDPRAAKKSEMRKTLTAGSGDVAPSQKTGGAALTREKLESAAKTWPHYDKALKFIGTKFPKMKKDEVEAMAKYLASRALDKAETILSTFVDTESKDEQNNQQTKALPIKTNPKQEEIKQYVRKKYGLSSLKKSEEQDISEEHEQVEIDTDSLIDDEINRKK